MVHVRTLCRQFLFVLSTLIISASVLSTLGCGKEIKTSTANENIAVTPLDNCATGTTYQGSAWNQTPYASINAVPYGQGVRGFRHDQQNVATQGYCGCAIDTQPMCDGTYGVVCVPGRYLNQHRDIAWYQHGPRGFAFSGFGGYTAYTNVNDPRPPNMYPNRQSYPNHRRHRGQPYPPPYQPVVEVQPVCQQQMGQTCTVGINSCGPTSICRPLGPNQSIGVCTR